MTDRRGFNYHNLLARANLVLKCIPNSWKRGSPMQNRRMYIVCKKIFGY